MKLLGNGYRWLSWGALFLMLTALLGCPAAERPAAEQPAGEMPAGEQLAGEEPAEQPMDPPAAAQEAPAVEPEAAAAAPEPVSVLPEPAMAPARVADEDPVPYPDASPTPERMAGPSPPAAAEEAAEDAMAFPKPAEVDETWQMPKPEPWDLGPPLVDDVAKLKPLDPEKPVWLDMENKSVVFVGKVCQREVPLELFACIRHTKEHEAIVVADLTAITVHAGLLAVGAEPGNPVQYNPEYIPARGTEIEVTVRWKDASGKVQTARAQDWIQNTKTGEAMTEPWVFGGSGFWVEPSGEKVYQAQGGDFICVANFGTAMLDVPVESSYANNMLMYRAFTERIPPLETPVTIILTPKPGAKD